jgi:serine/threonine protein kinase
MNENQWSLKSFTNLVEIGKGSFSRVFSAVEIGSQKQVALKVISIENSTKLNVMYRVRREVDT